MKRKFLITITVVLTIVSCVLIFAGCTESLKQDRIPTDLGKPVEGNGGMTVVYGNYLYFINGYAGESADNTFGKVVKGAVARVELENGVPKGEAQIIVPKNVYGTDTNYGGIYVSNDYIYYATTNTELDGNGAAKTGECVLMRTKVDGTDTKVIAAFDDHSVVFKVVGDKLVYIRSNAIYSIDLNSKKFDVTTVESTIGTGYLMDDKNIYYVVNIDGDTANNEMRVYPIAGGETKTILNAEILGKQDIKYTFGLLSVINEGDNVRLFYTKKDNTQGNPEEGIYSLVCSASTFAYSAEAESRFTKNSNGTSKLDYTKFYKAGKYYIGRASDKIDAFDGNGNRIENAKGIESLNVGSSITVFDVEETSDSVYLWYLDSSNALHKIKIIAKTETEEKFVEGNETKMFAEKFDKTYVGAEKVGNVIYYFNSNVSNNAYYYVLSEEKPAEGKGKILGIITEADIVAAF